MKQFHIEYAKEMAGLAGSSDADAQIIALLAMIVLGQAEILEILKPTEPKLRPISTETPISTDRVLPEDDFE